MVPQKSLKEALKVQDSQQVDAMSIIDGLALEVAAATKRAVIAEARVAQLEEKLKESK